MKKFENAFRGIVTGWLHKSIRVQFILAAMAVTAGMILKLEAMEWTAVIICIGLVITAEMLNTCVEMLCDLHTKEFNSMVRDIKDIAAGAVLVSSLTALICALVILVRHI